MSSTVTIHYPFHPHAGQTLPVVSRPRHADGAYTVNDPAGYTLKVPVWMTESAAATCQLSDTPFLTIAALREVYALLSLHDWGATLLSSHPHQGGQHETTQSVSRSPGQRTRAHVKAFFEREREGKSDAD
jgi:hypothetical protein